MNLLSIAKKFGTPLYIYDARYIRNQVQKMKEAFSGHHSVEMLFAVKCNYNPHLMKLLLEQGVGLDAVSPEEVELGLSVGVPKDKILFTQHATSDAKLRFIHEQGVLVNIGAVSTLERFGRMFPGAEVCLRVNAEFGAACHSSNITAGPDCKFGISRADITAAKQIVEQYNLRVVGLHAHNGSGWLSISEPLMSVDVLLETAKEFKGLSFVDIGGGFGVPYAPTDTPIDISFVGKSIVEKFARYEQETGENVTLRLEPGRYFVAESCSLVAQVTETKQLGNGRPYVGLDTSMAHLIRPALYGSYHGITNLSRSGEEMLTDIGGDVCECADYFATKRLFPKSEIGDIVAISTAGAYGFAMSSEYQFRPRPIEILVDGEGVTVIRRRETVEDLLKKYG